MRRKPSSLRSLIWPLAARLKSSTSTASSPGSEPCVFPPAKLLVEPLDHVGGADRLPLSQLLMHRPLDRDAHCLVDQLPERDCLRLLRLAQLPDRLRHGAFLRWSPGKAAGWWLPKSNRKNARLAFPHDRGHDPAGHRHGSDDQSFHRPVAWRPPVGHRHGRRARHDVPFYFARRTVGLMRGGWW